MPKIPISNSQSTTQKHQPENVLMEMSRFLSSHIEQQRPVVVALSGGVDSVVLLHLCHELRKQIPELLLYACHVNHGISDNANDWQTFCQTLTTRFNVEFLAEKVDLSAFDDQGLEAQARSARYHVFQHHTPKNAIILTGHHSDDQAETFFLRLRRGSGPKGLAAMAESRLMEAGKRVYRPLLSVSRDAIVTYAEENELLWIEDESNSNTDFDRNFVRHDVLPVLNQRFPQFTQMVTRAASLCGEQELLLQSLISPHFDELLSNDGSIAIDKLTAHSPLLQVALLRKWFDYHQQLMPTQELLNSLFVDVMKAKADAEPKIELAHHVIKRYRSSLFMLEKAKQVDMSDVVIHDFNEKSRVELPNLAGLLCISDVSDAERQTNALVFPAEGVSSIEVRFDAPKEKIALAYRGVSKTIKQIFKEAGVPPWNRTRTPFVYFEGELLGGLGMFNTNKMAQLKQQAGPMLKIEWEQ